MENFLDETLAKIKKSGHDTADIVFIGNPETGHSCTWDEFVAIANIEYDSGYGSQEIAADLVIVFKDKSRLYRAEYDGSEWWEYMPPFKAPKKTLPIRSVCVRSDESLRWDAYLPALNEEK